MAFDAKQFGTAIRKLRVDLGLTQSELSQKMGLTQAAVVMIEQGKRGVSMETIDSLGRALNVPAECLSVLAFRPMSNSKELADFGQSLKKLILAVVDARNSMTKQTAIASPARVRSKPVKATTRTKVRSRMATARVS